MFPGLTRGEIDLSNPVVSRYGIEGRYSRKQEWEGKLRPRGAGVRMKVLGQDASQVGFVLLVKKRGRELFAPGSRAC